LPEADCPTVLDRGKAQRDRGKAQLCVIAMYCVPASHWCCTVTLTVNSC